MLEIRVDYNEIAADETLAVAVANVLTAEDGDSVLVRDPGDDAIYKAVITGRTERIATLRVDWDSAEEAALVAHYAASAPTEPASVAPSIFALPRHVVSAVQHAWFGADATAGAKLDQKIKTMPITRVDPAQV